MADSVRTKLSGVFELFASATLLQIFALIFTLCFGRWVMRGIYRIYFHPLKGFHGPRLSAFTRIPYIYAIATGKQHIYLSDLHDRYGEVVRVSPDELSFINTQAWRDMHGYSPKSDRGTQPHKHWTRYGKAVNGVDSLILIKNDAEHARVRKIFSPAFSDRALTQQEPLFTKYIDQLVQILKESSKDNSTQEKAATVDLVRLYSFTTFDVMGDLTFGEPLHMLTNGDYDPWTRTIFGSLKAGLRLNLIQTFYPAAAKLLYPIFETLFSKMRFRLFETNVQRVTKRLEKGRQSSGVDLWDLILKQEDQGKKGLTRGEMDSNASTFMIAGTETTATLLSGLTYLLLENTDCLAKLVGEIREAFVKEEQITMEAVAKLPYLKACINEAFRLYPPVAAGLPRLTPADGSTVCGVWVPPGTTVSVPHYAMYRHASNFSSPHSFHPERWTGDPRFSSDSRAALQPFSIGSRDCLGKNMALHEMRLIMSKVLWNFDLELCEESRGWMDQSVFLLWMKKPLVVRVKVAERG